MPLARAEKYTCDLCGKRINRILHEKLNGMCTECAGETSEGEGSQDAFWNVYDRMKRRSEGSEE